MTILHFARSKKPKKKTKEQRERDLKTLRKRVEEYQNGTLNDHKTKQFLRLVDEYPEESTKIDDRIVRDLKNPPKKPEQTSKVDLIKIPKDESEKSKELRELHDGIVNDPASSRVKYLSDKYPAEAKKMRERLKKARALEERLSKGLSGGADIGGQDKNKRTAARRKDVSQLKKLLVSYADGKTDEKDHAKIDELSGKHPGMLKKLIRHVEDLQKTHKVGNPDLNTTKWPELKKKLKPKMETFASETDELKEMLHRRVSGEGFYYKDLYRLRDLVSKYPDEAKAHWDAASKEIAEQKAKEDEPKKDKGTKKKPTKTQEEKGSEEGEEGEESSGPVTKQPIPELMHTPERKKFEEEQALKQQEQEQAQKEKEKADKKKDKDTGTDTDREPNKDTSFLEAVKDKKFKNNETGNKVLFESLPEKQQKEEYKKWQTTNKSKKPTKKPEKKPEKKPTKKPEKKSVKKAASILSSPELWNAASPTAKVAELADTVRRFNLLKEQDIEEAIDYATVLSHVDTDGLRDTIYDNLGRLELRVSARVVIEGLNEMLALAKPGEEI